MENFREVFENKTILITGGTGFLGKNLAKEILKYSPHSIRIFSRDEMKHHKIKEEIRDKRIRNLIGDVRDYERIKRAIKGCDIVIHAAALKRIDMIEYNVGECINTNILGTINIMNACLENNVDKAIYVSTDKACSPINTYGASKFIGERVFIESNFSKGPHKTVFICVRYGNVLGSTGSLIPIIKEKIKKRDDLKLTDNRMTRFFINPEKACDLIFLALKYGAGGEVFVPKLKSFKVIDIMEFFKKFSNYNKSIQIVGLRPGEKIHEVLINESETPRTFEFDGFYVITSQIEKYQDNISYDYLSNARPVNFLNYSSEDFLVPIYNVEEQLRTLNVLN